MKRVLRPNMKEALKSRTTNSPLQQFGPRRRDRCGDLIDDDVDRLVYPLANPALRLRTPFDRLIRKSAVDLDDGDFVYREAAELLRAFPNEVDQLEAVIADWRAGRI